MRVTCPACGASYEVPDRMIGPEGRKLRCAKCGEQWLAKPPEGAAVTAPAPPVAAPPPTAAPPPSPPPAPPEPPAAPAAPAPMPAVQRPPRTIEPPLPPADDAPPPRASRRALALAWTGTALFVLGLGVALVLFRAEIVEGWPPAARFYQAIGLEG